MSNLVKQTDESGYRARADRPIQSGRVVSVSTVNNTVILDIGMVNALGVPVYMIDVPFSPQNPPSLQDTVVLLRSNSSPYSMVIGGGAQIGGANSGQVVLGAGGTTGVSAPTLRGQILYSLDGLVWSAETPLAGDLGTLITEDETGYLVVSG